MRARVGGSTIYQDVAEGVMAEDHTRLVAECYEIGLQKVIVARWTRERVQESN
jgi:hypothetical protein